MKIAKIDCGTAIASMFELLSYCETRKDPHVLAIIASTISKVSLRAQSLQCEA